MKNLQTRNFKNFRMGRRVIGLNRRQVSVYQVSTSEAIDHLDKINFVNWNFGKTQIEIFTNGSS